MTEMKDIEIIGELSYYMIEISSSLKNLGKRFALDLEKKLGRDVNAWFVIEEDKGIFGEGKYIPVLYFTIDDPVVGTITYACKYLCFRPLPLTLLWSDDVDTIFIISTVNDALRSMGYKIYETGFKRLIPYSSS